MMDINGIRRANLLALAEGLKRQQPNLRQLDIATALDLSPAHFSQIKGDKIIGDDVARKIEAARQLPFGWMDNVHDVGATRVEEDRPAWQSHVLRIDPETIAAALKLVRLAFLQREQEIDQEVNGEPLAYAYDFLISRREQAVTPENVVEFGLALKRRKLGDEDESQARLDRGTGGSDRKHDEGRKAG